MADIARTLEQTLFVVGPGGIGKGAIDEVIRDDVIRLDAHRLRLSGPRSCSDSHYAHPRLYEELIRTYRGLGLASVWLSADVEWFAEVKTVFMRVREEWHVLFLDPGQQRLAIAEAFGPALLVLLSNQEVRDTFGQVRVIVLNPAARLSELHYLETVTNATERNTARRGDDEASIRGRVRSIEQEAPAWRKLLGMGATEFAHWQFPEYRFDDEDRAMLRTQIRETLLVGDPGLIHFVKSEAQLPKTEG